MINEKRISYLGFCKKEKPENFHFRAKINLL